MQCPGCRARLPMNLTFTTCPRCGRGLGAGAPPPELSSPSLQMDLGKGFWKPRHLWAGTLDVVELVFSPRTAWEAWLADPGAFLGRRSPPGYAALVLTTVGALLAAVVMTWVGETQGVPPYQSQRQWAVAMVLLVPLLWLAQGFFGLGLCRALVMRRFPNPANAREARANASRVAVLGSAPALGASLLVPLWVVPEVGPALSALGVAYCMRGSLVGFWRGSGMVWDLDASARTRLLFTLAMPLTLLMGALGGFGLLVLVAFYP
jgi:hypothetical protein